MGTLTARQKENYVFESFLPYRDALHLARWLQGLMILQRLLGRGGPICENACYGAGLAAQHIAPQIRSAAQSEEEFQKARQREESRSGLNEQERRDLLEEETEELARELREKIDSGEIDIWDDTPVWVDRGEVQKFISRSLDYIEEKICPACNGEVSLLEKLVPIATAHLRKGTSDRGLYATLMIWDYARMYYEGEPPYRVTFSAQVAETLGIDPQMESVKLQKMRPLGIFETRRLEVARKLAKERGEWASEAEMDALTRVLELDQAVKKHLSLK